VDHGSDCIRWLYHMHEKLYHTTPQSTSIHRPWFMLENPTFISLREMELREGRRSAYPKKSFKNFVLNKIKIFKKVSLNFYVSLFKIIFKNYNIILIIFLYNLPSNFKFLISFLYTLRDLNLLS
jgi:hypothetical protein